MERTMPHRIIFAGSRDIGARCLAALLTNPAVSVVGVFLDPLEALDECAAHALRSDAITTARDINAPWSLDIIRSLHADALVSVRYPNKVSAEVLGLVPRAANLHMGALPEYAGSASVAWAILNGETQAGATLHVMDAKIDAGDVIAECSVPIGSRETAGSVHRRLVDRAFAMFVAAFPAWVRGDLPVAPMRTKGRRFYKRGTLPHEVAVAGSGVDAERQIRALLAPGFPPPFFVFDGERYEVRRAS